MIDGRPGSYGFSKDKKMDQLNVVEVWKDLHQMPELGFEEFKTSAYLAEKLEAMGYTVQRGIGGTGLLVTVQGEEPGPVVLLRADMDALPFQNEDGSIERIHACGHDAHSAMLLVTAQNLLGKVRRGTLKIFFQPAEETLGGALSAVKAGVLDDVDYALGCHIRPVQDIPAGTLCAAVRHSASTFGEIHIHGRAAHGSRPHLGINCAEAAAMATLGVCAIKCNPAQTWSVKVTSIQATSAAANIIPDQAILKLDIRAQTNELMDEILTKLRKVTDGVAETFGAEAEFVLPGIVIPAAVYDDDLTAEVGETIREEIGSDKLWRDCGGGGEDFHFFAKERPHIKAAYFGVGVACEPGLHNRNMHFDPEYLNNGVKVMTAMALKKVG